MLLCIMVKLIIMLQNDFSILIQTYVDILNQLIAENQHKLNRCKPPLCDIINEQWKLNNIEQFKQSLLQKGNLHDWPYYREFKTIFIKSIREIYLSCDLRAYAGPDYFIRYNICDDLAEKMFFSYRDQINYKDIPDFKHKLWITIIPILDKYGISQRILYQFLYFILFHYCISLCVLSIKFYYNKYQKLTKK